MDVKLPDGTVVKNIPEGTSKADLVAKLKANGMAVPDSWSTPAPAQEPSMVDKLKGIAGSLYGNLEAVPALASGAIAQPIAGLAGLATGGNADVVNKVQNAMTYQPRTDQGKATMQAIDNTVGMIPKGADYVGGKVADVTGSPALGAAANTALQAIPMALGAKFGPKSTGMTSTLNDTAAASLKDAGDLNMVVTPSDAGMSGATPAAKGAESSGSMTKLQQMATKVNANRIVDGVKEDLHIPANEQLTPDRLKQVDADANAMYQAARDSDKNQVPVRSPNGMVTMGPDGKPLTQAAGPLNLGKDYYVDVENIGKDRVNPDFETKIGPEVQAIKDELSAKTSMSPDGLIRKMNDLRDEARGNMNGASANNQTKALGRAQMQAANVLQNQLKNYLQKDQPGVYQAFLQGRQLKAKLATLKDAYDSGSGNISAQVLNRDLEAGEPLGGNMEKIGRIYGQFSKVMGDPTKIATGNHSIVDAGLVAQGVLRALHGDPTGLVEAGAGAARPLSRARVLTPGYQSMLQSGQAPSELLSRLAVPAAGASPLANIQQTDVQ